MLAELPEKHRSQISRTTLPIEDRLGVTNRVTIVADQWKHQLRVVLKPDAAKLARETPGSGELSPLPQILDNHQASLKCQYDAFAGYVAEAERNGTDGYPLYEWTKATIENDAKKAKYLSVFTIYAGGQEVYDAAIADALMAEIEPLVGGPLIQTMSRHDTNPANNPQPPKKFSERPDVSG